MRVALVPSAYAPTVGGVEEVARHLGRCLTAAGDEVEVWAPRPDGHADVDDVDDVAEVDGIVVRRFPMPLPRARLRSVARFPFDGLPALGAVRGAARRFRPDLLHVQCFSVNGVYATAVAALERVPLVVSLSGETLMDDHDVFDRSVALRTGLRVALGRAAAVTGCSQFAIDDAVRRFGLPPGAGRVIFNGVDLAEPAGGTVDVPFERYVLGLGRVVWKKGFDLLLDAFAEAGDRLAGVGLVVAGDGPFRVRLEERARRLGVADRVHFTGALDRGRVAAVMAAAAAFVMPSRIEPFGIVVLEAWRAGCPVVASRIGGATEFVTDGVNGMLVDPFDTAELAAALSRVLTDQRLRRTLVDNASAAIKDFDWSAVAGRYREVYAGVTRRQA